jgi:hypothetical protein
MRARAPLAALLCLAASLLLAAPAGAVELEEFDVTFTSQGGEAAMAAGQHPFALTTSFEVQAEEREVNGIFGLYPVEAVKDLRVGQVEGLAGDVAAVPRCTAADFLLPPPEAFAGGGTGCPDASAVGTVTAEVGEAGESGELAGAAYSLVPPPGRVARLGFKLGNVRVTVDLRISESPPYRILASLRGVSQALEFFSSRLTIWGNPAAAAHDPYRGVCLAGVPDSEGELQSLGQCPAGLPEVAFLTNPRACEGPLDTLWQTTSWQHPGAPPATGRAQTHDAFGAQRGFSGCAGLPFSPSISARPSARAAASPSGLDFGLDVPDPGFANPAGLASADIEKTVVTFPKGLTINPSQAEGLEVCSEAQLARERSDSAFGAGCPAASKIGTIEIETPALPEALLKGQLFVAEPYANPTGSLIAVYVVIKDAGLGISIAQPIEVSPDPRTGQLVSTASGMPQLPFSHFRLRFREGPRAPLISPPGCGRFDAAAKLYPYSGGAPVASTSTFEIVSGPDNGPCPSGAPFDPGFEAGTLNNAAGAYSPFVMRLTRADAEQDLGRFSAILPPGVVGRIAGIPWCPEAGIARAKSRTGEHGGQEELADPSCPAASQIGRTVAGAGVASQLTYVPGSLYLAGPYHGAPLSVVSVTPAVAGPFDAGTVVVREALALNPITAEVQVDGAASDPIPHILKGIPLNLRDLRVHADRPGFTLNATSCAEGLTRATLWGDGTAIAPAGETPVGRAARYQAAGCASLGFKPKLAIKLKGGTRRGAHPALRAVVTPRAGDANFAGAVVRLPHSAFLEQAHIRTVCTRVQFNAGPGNGAGCPPGAVYGHATAWSPLLAQPLQGPVFLRSSNHKLPDLIVALHGLFDLDLGARIDSVKGGIRTTFAPIPDAPVSRFVLKMQGGRKGLIVNSKNLCVKPKANRARAALRAQNGKRRTLRPVVRAVRCKKHKRGAKSRSR